MTRKPAGPVFGAFLALVQPVSYVGLGSLIDHGVLPYSLMRPFLDLLGLFSLSEFALGAAGIIIVGRALGVNGAFGWIVVAVISVPAIAIVWFLSLVAVSGALGNPF